MFVTITLFTLGIIIYLSLFEWIRRRPFSSKWIRKSLKEISQHILLENFEEAKKQLTPLLMKGKGGKETALFEIQVLRGTKNLIEALNKAQSASRHFPEELLFRFEEGKVLLDLHRAQEALEALRVCHPILRGESDFYIFASALYHAGYASECLECLTSLLKMTRNGKLFALAADAACERRLFKEAIHFYNQSLALGHSSHHVYVQLGHALRRLGDLDQAEFVFTSLLNKDAQDLEATLGLGACLQAKGQYQKALFLYQSQSVWESGDMRLMKEAGISALYTKKYLFAECYFLEALKKDPSNIQLLSYYGYSLECQKKWESAEALYQQLIRKFPSSPHGYWALAWMFGVGLTSSLSNQDGVKYAHTALHLKDDLISWEILSACEARIGNFDRAYQIQLSLTSYDLESAAKMRRQQILRILRKNLPLDDQYVLRRLVA